MVSDALSSGADKTVWFGENSAVVIMWLMAGRYLMAVDSDVEVSGSGLGVTQWSCRSGDLEG